MSGGDKSLLRRHLERIRNVAHSNVGCGPGPERDSDHVEPVRGTRPTMPSDPDLRAPNEFAPFAPVDRVEWAAERGAPSGLDLDERNETRATHDEVHVAVPRPEPAREDRPAAGDQPPFRDALAERAECLAVVSGS